MGVRNSPSNHVVSISCCSLCVPVRGVACVLLSACMHACMHARCVSCAGGARVWRITGGTFGESLHRGACSPTHRPHFVSAQPARACCHPRQKRNNHHSFGNQPALSGFPSLIPHLPAPSTLDSDSTYTYAAFTMYAPTNKQQQRSKTAKLKSSARSSGFAAKENTFNDAGHVLNGSTTVKNRLPPSLKRTHRTELSQRTQDERGGVSQWPRITTVTSNAPTVLPFVQELSSFNLPEDNCLITTSCQQKLGVVCGTSTWRHKHQRHECCARRSSQDHRTVHRTAQDK